MTRTLTAALSLFVLSGSALAISIYEPAESKPGREGCIPQAEVVDVEPITICGFSTLDAQDLSQIALQQTYVDVVFVLDTTGSMGGLIEGAKQKIWMIANQIAQAQPAPIVRMGLVGYRDRGDDYVTTITALTEDIDTVYADLMAYKAQGGGDTPESVNEALFTAVERLDWTQQDGSLKLIYLVGDAPPKMGYNDDVKYQASCKIAHEKGININTIQCGNLDGTQKFWQDISQLANGAYAKIEQSGGVVAISTPYDKQLAQWDTDMRETMLDYGDSKMMIYQSTKRDRSSGISRGASPEAAADRAVYNSTSAGRKNAFGKQELVDDISTGAIAFDEVKNDQLPVEMQSMSEEELKAEIDKRKTKRVEISKNIKELAAKRAEYLRDNQPKAGMNGFDQKVIEALIEQGGRVGIDFASKKDDSETKEPTKEVGDD